MKQYDMKMKTNDNFLIPSMSKKHGLCIGDDFLLPVDVEECVEFAGVRQAGPCDRQHAGRAHCERLESEITRVCELSKETLDAPPAAHARHQLGECAEHLT